MAGMPVRGRRGCVALKIDKVHAEAVLRAEAEAALRGAPVDSGWRAKVLHLSDLCAEGGATTHIAFLGTSMLAKAMDRRGDLFAIKPKLDPGNAHAYSARTLCHAVLVPLSAELGFSIGVTGREPLNNQPYFRMTRLGDDTPIHAGSRAAFDAMVGLIGELARLRTEDGARAALRAYVDVRRGFQPVYSAPDEGGAVSPARLLLAINAFVGARSEGGRCAQAAVAGLMDVVFGAIRVVSGRINDPSRHLPGDVCVLAANGSTCEKAIEVRDKPVRASDIKLFAQKCVMMGVRDAVVVAGSSRQPPLDRVALAEWANALGIGLTVYAGWQGLVEQSLFWAPPSQPEAAALAVQTIHRRLVSVEASPEAVMAWREAAIEAAVTAGNAR